MTPNTSHARSHLLSLLSFVAPPLCGACAAPASPQAILCLTCERELEAGHGVFVHISGTDAAWAARPYDGVARSVVAGLKFSARLRLAERAAGLIADEAPRPLLDGTFVPVPAAPRRRLWRGFDPAEEIAKALAGRCGAGLEPCLARSQSPRQVGRPRALRRAAPPLVRALEPAPLRAILVDDVVTTGATISSCAAALRRAGSGWVAALTLAGTKSPLSRVHHGRSIQDATM